MEKLDKNKQEKEKGISLSKLSGYCLYTTRMCKQLIPGSIFNRARDEAKWNLQVMDMLIFSGMEWNEMLN